MKILIFSIAVNSLIAGSPEDWMGKQNQASAAMAASIEKQRASINKQIESFRAPAAGFFTVPWSTPSQLPAPEAAAQPQCDPIPIAQIAPLVEDAAQREDLRRDVLNAVIKQESAFRPCAVSAKGALGLMQLMPATVEQFSVQDPFDPRQNIDAGAKLLKQLMTRFGGDLALALGAYNAGPGNVDAAGGVPPFAETENYVKTILASLPIR